MKGKCHERGYIILRTEYSMTFEEKPRRARIYVYTNEYWCKNQQLSGYRK